MTYKAELLDNKDTSSDMYINIVIDNNLVTSLEVPRDTAHKILTALNQAYAVGWLEGDVECLQENK